MGWTDDLQVFCVDVGSIARGRFAWTSRHQIAESDEEAGRAKSIGALAAAVAETLDAGAPAALGFEAPLFVPVPTDPGRLGKARPCDAPSPAWSSSVGASVLATAMAQIPWVLRSIHEHAPDQRVHLRWAPFAAQRQGLLLWEAFVSGPAKGTTDEEDARSGIEAFCAQLPSPGESDAEPTERPFSLLAAAALWAGFELPIEDLRDDCLLVRATQPPA